MVYEEKFKVRGYSLDENCYARPLAIMGYMQDAAALHCIPLHLTGPELQAEGITWVITNFTIEYYYYPYWSEELKVETWAKDNSGFRTRRDYLITTMAGRLAAAGASCWSLLDMNTRKPVPVAYLGERLQYHGDKAAFDNWKPEKIVFEEDGDIFTGDFQACYYDLDFNNHLNNLKYMEWAMNTVPAEYQRENVLSRWSVQFLDEVFLGDKITVKTVRKGDLFHHSLINKENGRTCCRASGEWKKKN